MTTPSDHWIDCIRAFLHDPPDKALDIKGHELRAARYQNAAFDVPGDPVRAGAVKPADWLASAIERLPLPKGTLRDCDGNPLDPILEQPFNRIPRDQLRRTSPIDGSDLTNDTMSLRQAQNLTATAVDQREAIIRTLAQANPDHRLRALALWRLLPDRLPHVCALPGDTRLTDHSIIDHADATMATCAALRDGGSASLLTFSLGPVQAFIVQGRSLRDLWTGSYLLSWLTFHAMTPILAELGPWCITSPGLRGNPLCDWWLGQQQVRDEHGANIAATDGLDCAGIPNTFTALVPTAMAAILQQRVTDACAAAWQQICNAVHTQLRDCWGTDWDTSWDDQCAEVWDMRCVTVPVLTVTSSGSVSDATAELRKLYQRLIGELPQSVLDASTIAAALGKAKLSPGYVSESGQGLWPLANYLTQRLLGADKRARHIPAHAPADDTREKCALFAGCAVMGPLGDTRANKSWWTDHAKNVPGRLVGRLRGSERLSAPGLVKRFAYGAFFRDIVRVHFQDTREVAFGDWVAQLRASPHGVLLWNNWQKTVAGINRRSDDTTDQEWADHDLLDEGSMVAAHWVHDGADEATQRTELDKARKERAKLVAKATSAGLPDPRPYYAVLVADGDNMGKILRGEKGPSFQQAYHPLMLTKLREIGLSSDVLSRVRPQGMAAQLAFSRHLGEFTRQASSTIAKHRGNCVYAGGDDVLAVLPVANALAAAADLARDFSTWVPGATLSAGLAIVHCQEDLRMAIEAARAAEQLAKQSGKNCLGCAIVRRSGDTTQAVTSWSLVGEWQQASVLLADRSDRWVHHLLSERDTLRLLPPDAVWARIRHLLLHGEEGGRVGKDLGGLFDRIRTAWGDFAADHERVFNPSRLDASLTMCQHNRESEQHESEDNGRIDQFLTWCQHAAWLARFQMTDKAQS